MLCILYNTSASSSVMYILYNKSASSSVMYILYNKRTVLVAHCVNVSVNDNTNSNALSGDWNGEV